MKDAKFKFTDGQKELHKVFKKFLEGPDKFFLLTGKPGVGKSTMLKYLLKHLIDEDIKYGHRFNNANVIGITFAHQAKNVLGEFIPNVCTFAKAFGLKEQYDEVSGKRSFVYDEKNRDPKIGSHAVPVFIHDEISQYTKEMIDIVTENLSAFSKVIFVGDRAQLPPVDSDPNNKDKDSPIFEMEFNKDCSFELTERVRQGKENPILSLTDLIREEIFRNHDIRRIIEFIDKNKGLINGEGYEYLLYKDLKEHIKEKDFSKTRLVAYRNKTIDYFNYDLRNFLLNYPNNAIVDGDIICMTDNYYKETAGVPLYVLHNSSVFELEKVFTKVENIAIGGKHYKVDCYVANIKNEMKQFIAVTESSYQQFQENLSDLADRVKAREITWADFWQYKNSFCKYIYGYCVTAYKVQGSTYDTVYVDLNDIMLTGPLTPKRKLQAIYTAITRARYDAYFLTNKIRKNAN